jgi:hypothetical protein
MARRKGFPQSSANDASLFLCAVDISLLGRSEGDPKLALWNEVYEAVWFMTLLYGSHVEGRSWRYLFVLLMGALPKHLDLVTDTGIDKLSEIVAAFAGDEELTIHTVAHLFRTGTASQLLTNAASRAHVDLESALGRSEQNAGNAERCPLSKYWKDAGSISRQILGLSVG